MTDDVRNIVLGVIAAGISAALGWLARTYLWRRKLRRKQAFFGLPGNSECLLVVNRDAGGDGAVHRHDVFALLELSALIKDCSAHAQILYHDIAQQGIGERTEFCVGGPVSNRRVPRRPQSTQWPVASGSPGSRLGPVAMPRDSIPFSEVIASAQTPACNHR